MIGNNLDTKFEKLFENYSEDPSSNCWDVVSHRLDVLMPAGSSSASGVSSGTSAFSKFIVSTVGKSVAIISAVSVVGVSLYSILNNNEPKPVPTIQLISTTEKQVKENKTTEKQMSNPFHAVYQQDNNTSSTLSDEYTVSASNDNTQNIAEKATDSHITDNNITPISVITPKTTPAHPIATNTDNHHSEEQVDVQETTDNTSEVIQNNDILVEKAPIADQNVVNSNLVFPNVFTPNGDGVNDYFVIKNIESFSRLVVVNAKTGQKVFEANNYQNNWDAANAPDGAYYYVLETKIDGKNQTYYGTVQIIR